MSNFVIECKLKNSDEIMYFLAPGTLTDNPVGAKKYASEGIARHCLSFTEKMSSVASARIVEYEIAVYGTESELLLKGIPSPASSVSIDQEQVKTELRNNLRAKIRSDLANSGCFVRAIGGEELKKWTPVLGEFTAAGYRVTIDEFQSRALYGKNEGGYHIVVRFRELQQEGTSRED